MARGPQRRTPHLGLLLVTIGAVYIVVIACGVSRLAGPIQIGLLGLVLVVTTRLNAGAARWTSVAVSGAVVALVAGACADLTRRERLAVALTSLAVLLLVAASIASISRFLWCRRSGDRQTVAGALAVYLLLALLFSGMHQFLAAVLGQPYLDGVSSAHDGASYLYFSVVTLTTVGYGDLTPSCHAARAVAIAEALTSQVYLVTVVSAVVGNWTGGSTAAPRRRARPATARRQARDATPRRQAGVITPRRRQAGRGRRS